MEPINTQKEYQEYVEKYASMPSDAFAERFGELAK